MAGYMCRAAVDNVSSGSVLSFRGQICSIAEARTSNCPIFGRYAEP